MSKKNINGIILAAGKGTRMKSDYPKCAHKVCGLPMAEHAAQAMIKAGVEKPILVVGFQSDVLKRVLSDNYAYVEQKEQLGTGHAVMMARPLLDGIDGPVFISPGDAPLITSDIYAELLDHHENTESKMSILTTNLENPHGYGRIFRRFKQMPTEIIEEKDTNQITREIKEVNSGVYCVDSKILLEYLPKLSNNNAQNEYYFTELVSLLFDAGHKVSTLCVDDSDILIGVNDRWQLAEASGILQRKILRDHALNGVTIVDPLTTYIGIDVEIGLDTIIEPMTQIEGNTKIGKNCTIGPSSKILDSIIGDECSILMSNLNEATMHKGARCGPFANMRPDANIGESSKIGNFVEVKNANIGSNVSISHLTYIGDSKIGNNTNIGAGTITCNYDGFDKHCTEIGENVFVGSNSTLIAPIKIENGSIIGAGSVISETVPENSLALGRSRQENKTEWAYKWRQKKQINKV